MMPAYSPHWMCAPTAWSGDRSGARSATAAPMVTGGGLLFVGRADGRLTALDKRNGAKLWEFMTDAGVNTTVTTFEHKGRQYVVVHAGGGAFANGKRGDGIWMFSLDGKIGPIVPTLAARGWSWWPGGPGARRRRCSGDADARRRISRQVKRSTRLRAWPVMGRRAPADTVAARHCWASWMRRRSAS